MGTLPEVQGSWGLYKDKRRAGRGVCSRHICFEPCLLPEQLLDLKLTVDGLEKERDFYFSKLRDIELICQEHESENSPVIAGIISILYATEVSVPFPGPCLPLWPGPRSTSKPGPERSLERIY